MVAPAVGLPLGADVVTSTEKVGDEVCPAVGPSVATAVGDVV